MSELADNQAEAIKTAKEKGFTTYRSAHNRLLLDLDAAGDIAYFDKNFEWTKALLAEFDIYIYKHASWFSKSGKGLHRYLRVESHRALNAVDRMLIEVCLGSDKKRAMLSLARYYKGNNEPGTLFRPEKSKSKGSEAKRKLPLPEPEWPYDVPLDDDVPF